ncbi:MAG: transcription-repair coupling factor [Gammaproteobacteria bacterium]|nr:transcription-repair coupling factor [Gammaproteobacteria bacterium]
MQTPESSRAAPSSDTRAHGTVRWSALEGAALALALAKEAARASGPLLVCVADARTSDALAAALAFFTPGDLPVLAIPEREMLPYDSVSPASALTSERLSALVRLPTLDRGIIFATADLLLERLPPREWLQGASFDYAVGQRLGRDAFRRELVSAGYASVGEVREPGEFAVRGGLIDVFPAGSNEPVRIDLFDEEIDSLRHFDPDTQLSGDKLERIRLLPAHEFPFDEDSIARFRGAWRARFAGDPTASRIYAAVSKGFLPAGIEGWLPFFFEETQPLAAYLPENATVVTLANFDVALQASARAIESRHESLRHDVERPILPPGEAFFLPRAVRDSLAGRSQLRIGAAPSSPSPSKGEGWGEGRNKHARLRGAAPHPDPLPAEREEGEESAIGTIRKLPDLSLAPRADEPLRRFIDFAGRTTCVLLTAESPGRRETIREALERRGLQPAAIGNWEGFLAQRPALGLAVAELESGFLLPDEGIAVVPDVAVFGARAASRRRQRRAARDPAAIIRDLTDLSDGSPVVHQDHGVGRFRGLVTRKVDGNAIEFVLLEYAGGDKLYVPVASLDRLSRYLGADTEHAPLTRLGGSQWDRARSRAAKRARDTAAELLELYARRAARPGHAFAVNAVDWERFVEAFPFEETPDQERAIAEVVGDLESDHPMDRLVCGDVGFGKTEIALRAAFIAVMAGCQVAILVPTTLLADQHYQSFADRFADWPVRVALLSRFRSAKQQGEARSALADGRIDIVIGTHALLNRTMKFKSLGLVIVDEEHRFGVRHKERLRALRAEVDMLTLTATPIPRTLSMTIAGIRDLSIIATAPEARLPIKTSYGPWQDGPIRDGLLRELRRGGQTFVVHNEVRSIGTLAERIRRLVPEAQVRVGHGQMAERELENLMVDFHHRRFDVLVSTTIVESGLDIPSANTILINNAHRFGLAQLHQLRGRVGRSHHQAYAHLVVPPIEYLGRDARSRLEAITSAEELGAGFFLATQDMEIRGAGALLGESQSGQIEEVGLELYNRLLARAVATLKAGGEVSGEIELDSGCEVDLGDSALLPDDYIPNVHLRLVLYKRIASAEDDAALQDLATEIADRFGALPDPARRLFDIARLKQRAQALGISRIHAGPGSAQLDFEPKPSIDAGALIRLVQSDPKTFRLHGEKRLTLLRELPDFARRVEALGHVLDALARRSASSPRPAGDARVE